PQPTIIKLTASAKPCGTTMSAWNRTSRTPKATANPAIRRSLPSRESTSRRRSRARARRRSLDEVKCGVGRQRPGSCHHCVLEVGTARRLDGPDLLELHLRGPEVVEEASSVAEQYRTDVELELIQ